MNRYKLKMNQENVKRLQDDKIRRLVFPVTYMPLISVSSTDRPLADLELRLVHPGDEIMILEKWSANINGFGRKVSVYAYKASYWKNPKKLKPVFEPGIDNTFWTPFVKLASIVSVAGHTGWLTPNTMPDWAVRFYLSVQSVEMAHNYKEQPGDYFEGMLFEVPVFIVNVSKSEAFYNVRINVTDKP